MVTNACQAEATANEQAEAMQRRVVELEARLAKAQEQSMRALIAAYRDWNFATFGDEKPRIKRIVEHIRSELKEVLADPYDILEWVDVMLFAWQGALRTGHSPEAIVLRTREKMKKNEGRRWSNDILPKEDVKA
jgi:predicted small metal-binding protein